MENKKQKDIESLLWQVLNTFRVKGLPNDQTAKRMTRMYEEFLKNENVEFNDFGMVNNTDNYNQFVGLDEIPFVSLCSHHFLPFHGKAWFYYLPENYLVGASKLGRIVQHFSARAQMQEGLCQIILNRFVEKIKPKGAILVMKATHDCITTRGAKLIGTTFTTSAIFGVLEHAEVRKEAFDLMLLSR